MNRNANDQITVSIDLGADTTKAACAYRLRDGRYEQELLLNHGEGIPSLAYYDTKLEKWVFGREEIIGYAEKSFRYLVRIRDLLELFFTRERDGLYDGRRYKNYHYPPRTDDSYEEAIAKGDYFESRISPRCVLELFVKYVMDRIKEEIGASFGNVSIRYVVVYPANAAKDYIDELVGFVSQNKDTRDGVYIISSARAVGVAAREYGIVKSSQKNVLIFNIGEEDISVVKVRFDKENIYAYGADGHNSPEKIGGRNIDIAIARYIDEQSSTIPAFGSRETNQTVEHGIYFDQYRMQRAIKVGKMIYPTWLAKKPKEEGYPFPLYREMIMDIPVDKKTFLSCCKGVYKKIWEYVKEELDRSDNKNDVDAILFSGGAADSFGLDEYVQKKLAENGYRVGFIDFSPDNNNALCAAKNTVPIGAALFGAGKYSFNVLTSLSYGTWTQEPSAQNPSIETAFAYVKLLEKDEIISLQGRPDFTEKKWGGSNNQYASEPSLVNGTWRLQNEYYSCDTSEILREAAAHSTRDMEKYIIHFCTYTPNTAKENKPFAGNAYIKYKVFGIDKKNKIKVTLNRVGKDYYIEYTLPKSVSDDDAEVIAKTVAIEEGFMFDYEGRPTPLVKNVSSAYYVRHPKAYKKAMESLMLNTISHGKVFHEPVQEEFLKLLDSVKVEIGFSGNEIKF